MPTFPAPGPVPVLVDVPFGNLHVVAGDRDDVVVTVLPTDPSSSGSVRAARDVRVERDGDTVSITYPGSWKQFMLPFAAGTANITVELPTGSDVRGKTGALLAEGRLGAVDLVLSAGDARVDEADRVDLKASAGSVVVGRAAGTANLRASAGSVRISELSGDGSVRAANGTTTVGSVTGTLTVAGAHADIAVGRVSGTVTARSAHAGIRVERVESGSVSLTTSYGSIEVGVPEGTAAWLDVASEHGTVRNQLTPTEGPVDDETTAEIHASTGYGDVVVRRP
ncbi:DUF4097 family beta strand repeat-containing protein [Cellulosimicrobium sp. CUA-896]|uniref:DUF4097 family beta strand repeat-containing protein n=1 Tax=Cellulosimicrobium sp. CUA-896 TaxID=1517881 RepID=UPI0009664D02|nr:DUF4097 family beta strand repeat-containing protein [Cellulosimicrobium sp. CUA-896]OLT53416.1 hypothetical protein BJF88_11670 [Cellulosimicrobium sp. CUA-896]